MTTQTTTPPRADAAQHAAHRYLTTIKRAGPYPRAMLPTPLADLVGLGLAELQQITPAQNALGTADWCMVRPLYNPHRTVVRVTLSGTRYGTTKGAFLWHTWAADSRTEDAHWRACARALLARESWLQPDFRDLTLTSDGAQADAGTVLYRVYRANDDEGRRVVSLDVRPLLLGSDRIPPGVRWPGSRLQPTRERLAVYDAVRSIGDDGCGLATSAQLVAATGQRPDDLRAYLAELTSAGLLERDDEGTVAAWALA